MTHSPEITEIAAALALAQGAIDGAKKNADNLHLKSKYANLAAVWDACREPLTANGLSVLQFPDVQANNLLLETILLHKSGEFFQYVLTLPIPQMTPQGVGTVITYARRYALSAIVGIAPDDDDDAQSATDAAKSTPKGRTSGREGVYGTHAQEPVYSQPTTAGRDIESEFKAKKNSFGGGGIHDFLLIRKIMDLPSGTSLYPQDYCNCVDNADDDKWRTAIAVIGLQTQNTERLNARCAELGYTHDKIALVNAVLGKNDGKPTPEELANALNLSLAMWQVAVENAADTAPNLALITTEEVPVVEPNHNLDAFGSGMPAGVA